MSEIPDARITRYDILIGDEKLPGLILDGGVTADFGGASGVNVLTVKFIVGRISVEDPTLLDTDCDEPEPVRQPYTETLLPWELELLGRNDDDDYPIGQVRG